MSNCVSNCVQLRYLWGKKKLKFGPRGFGLAGGAAQIQFRGFAAAGLVAHIQLTALGPDPDSQFPLLLRVEITKFLQSKFLQSKFPLLLRVEISAAQHTRPRSLVRRTLSLWDCLFRRQVPQKEVFRRVAQNEERRRNTGTVGARGRERGGLCLPCGRKREC